MLKKTHNSLYFIFFWLLYLSLFLLFITLPVSPLILSFALTLTNYNFLSLVSQLTPSLTINIYDKGKRTGGELSGMTVASTMGRRKAPVRRSRGARLDEELTRARNEVNKLETELDKFSNTLAQAEHDLVFDYSLS